MNEQALHEAVENISLIKSVISRTNKSFVAFSKIFIYWGLLFTVVGIINLVQMANYEKLFDSVLNWPLLNYVYLAAVALIAATIYWSISKKTPLISLEKHLIKIWMLVLIMNVIPTRVVLTSTALDTSMTNIVVTTNNFSTMFFSLAIALIATALFADYKQLLNLGLIYIAISVIYAFLRFPLFEGATLFQVLFALSLPFTFFYTGFFLRSRQGRGD
ncbi:MAG: hypothetical protein WDA53_07715 [Bacillota bacterium]